MPALKIGADQYNKTAEQYFAEVRASSEAVGTLSAEMRSIGDWIRDDLGRSIPSEFLRRAKWNGQPAGDVRAARWTGTSQFALAPHEDFSQITRAGFEIEDVLTPVAINLYPEVSKAAGAFRVYNIQPDSETRQRLGIETTGYPYPEHELESFEHLDIVVQEGDLLLFNGRFVHAVLAPQKGHNAARLLVNFFIGLTSDGGTILSWT